MRKLTVIKLGLIPIRLIELSLECLVVSRCIRSFAQRNPVRAPYPSNPTCTHAFAVARAVVRVMRVEFHIGATIKGVQTPEKALQRVGLEEGVVLGYAGNVNRKLIV